MSAVMTDRPPTPLQAIRKRLKLSQADMGEALGVNQSAASQYERGELEFPIGRAVRLLDLAASKGLQLTLDQVYGRADLPPDTEPATAAG